MEWHWKNEKHYESSCLPLVGLVFEASPDRAQWAHNDSRKTELAGEAKKSAELKPADVSLSSIVGKINFAAKGLCGRVGGQASIGQLNTWTGSDPNEGGLSTLR